MKQDMQLVINWEVWQKNKLLRMMRFDEMREDLSLHS